MAEVEVHREIARLEAEIEALAAVLASCRKFMLFARLAMAAGALWMILVALGIVAIQPLGLIAAVCAVIGGIVAFGSNASTARQSQAHMQAAEVLRAELIDRIDLVPVDGRSGLH
jgi:phage-related minor tail protein